MESSILSGGRSGDSVAHFFTAYGIRWANFSRLACDGEATVASNTV